MLATTTKGHSFDWVNQSERCLQYQCPIHHRLHPLFLTYGWKARLPVDVTYSTHKPELLHPSFLGIKNHNIFPPTNLEAHSENIFLIFAS
jgi:hypothetical protein